MDHSNTYMKWFSRLLLLVLLSTMAYVVTQPVYNFAHWVPHTALRRIGIPYDALLWGEQNADAVLHLVGAAALTLVFYSAQLPVVSRPVWHCMLSVTALCVSAEIAQLWIGRGFQGSDLLLGILGSFMAYLAIDKKK